MPAIQYHFTQVGQPVFRSPQPDGTVRLLHASQCRVACAVGEPEELLAQRDRLSGFQPGDDLLNMPNLGAFAAPSHDDGGELFLAMIPGAQASLFRGIPKYGQRIVAAWMQPFRLRKTCERSIADRQAAGKDDRLPRSDLEWRRSAGDILKNLLTGTQVAHGQLAGKPGLPVRQEIIHAVLVFFGPHGHLQHRHRTLTSLSEVHEP